VTGLIMMIGHYLMNTLIFQLIFIIKIYLLFILRTLMKSS